MNAPDRIYLPEEPFKDGNSEICWNYKPIGGIEYIHTDTFIEKVCEWIKEHKEAVETEDNGIIGWIPDYFIEDFRKYMKGE